MGWLSLCIFSWDFFRNFDLLAFLLHKMKKSFSYFYKYFFLLPSPISSGNPITHTQATWYLFKDIEVLITFFECFFFLNASVLIVFIAMSLDVFIFYSLPNQVKFQWILNFRYSTFDIGISIGIIYSLHLIPHCVHVFL